MSLTVGKGISQNFGVHVNMILTEEFTRYNERLAPGCVNRRKAISGSPKRLFLAKSLDVIVCRIPYEKTRKADLYLEDSTLQSSSVANR